MMDIYTYRLNGKELDIEYTYTKGEKAIDYYPDGSGYPGSPSLVEVSNIWTALKDRRGHLIHVDVKDIIQEEYLDLEILEEEILESIED